MRLQIEPTEKIIKVNGTECRAWIGISEKGAHCFVFVASVAVLDESATKTAEFEADLRSLPHPGREADFALLEIVIGEKR